MLEKMADSPLIMALANPNPEIDPATARGVRPDAIICTGRSDYPNQVNNVLCFPYIFRGALDVRCAHYQCRNEARRRGSNRGPRPRRTVRGRRRAYGGEILRFGPDFLIPSPFDNRLILRIAPAVAKAAMDSGVANQPIEDLDAYMDRLNRFVFRSGLIMKPRVAQPRSQPQKGHLCRRRG
jgi:malate dehydrogenase (oxaloacetate-decarboxylating)(NADP+)